MIHGLSSGIISYFRGGSFKAGFFSGLGSAFDIGTKGYGRMVGRTSIMAIIGGTFAKLGGGKFANGAMSAAFTHLFNAEVWAYSQVKFIKALSVDQLRKRRALEIMARRDRGIAAGRFDSSNTISYKQAYARVLSAEKFDRYLGYGLMLVAGGVFGRGVYMIAMRNPWMYEAGIDFISTVIPGSAPIATPEAVGAMSGAELYNQYNKWNK